MNPRNFVCWAGIVIVFIGLMTWGNSQPISLERGRRAAWSRLWRKVEAAPVPVPGRAAVKAPTQRPPPPPPPPPMTRVEAEDVIRASACREYENDIIPLLQQSIRVSTLPIDSPDELSKGAPRATTAADLPPGMIWPTYQGTPMLLVAQLRMVDVAVFDTAGVLPKSGWLCFFYAAAHKPVPTGLKPEHRGAWQVVHFEGEPKDLQRATMPKAAMPTRARTVEPPPGQKNAQPQVVYGDRFPPCRIRLWNEWTLPSLSDKPELFGESRAAGYYGDLVEALTGRPPEAGRHHLLGHPQTLLQAMPPVCALVNNGVTVTWRTDPNDPEIKEKTAGASDWRLLLQMDLSGLSQADAVAEAAGQSDLRGWGGFGGSDMLFYWIRQVDLDQHDFSRVWVIRQGYFGDDEADEMADDAGDEDAGNDEGGDTSDEPPADSGDE